MFSSFSGERIHVGVRMGRGGKPDDPEGKNKPILVQPSSQQLSNSLQFSQNKTTLPLINE